MDSRPPQGRGYDSSEVTPPVPDVRPNTLWAHGPFVLLDDGPYSIGWQGWDQNRGGPDFAVLRRGTDGVLEVQQRYPLTEEGWAEAWQALTELDPDTAGRIRAVLSRYSDVDRGPEHIRNWTGTQRGLIVTTDEIPGYRITQVHGDVFGLTVRARNYFSNLGAQLRTLAGGEVAGYTRLLTDSRNEARTRMWHEANARGANAVVGMRFDCNEIGDIMSEIVAYGTAVTIEPDSGHVPRDDPDPPQVR